MLEAEEKAQLMREIYMSHVLFSPSKRISVTYGLPGNIFTRLFFFFKLILVGNAKL
jgi:hypothetical protein